MFWENPSGSVYLDLNAKRHYFKDRTEFVRESRTHHSSLQRIHDECGVMGNACA